jgi:Glycosyl hydrolase family 79 C-terminal beta domain
VLPLYAADGINGVNFQTRPYTTQNLIQTNDTSAGWRVRVQPEYYGLLAFAKLTPPGSRILKVSTVKSGLYAWAAHTPQGQTNVVITNVGGASTSFAVKAAGASGKATVEALKASGGLSASTGVTLGGQTIDPKTGSLTGKLVSTTVSPRKGAYDITVPAASADIVSFQH